MVHYKIMYAFTCETFRDIYNNIHKEINILLYRCHICVQKDPARKKIRQNHETCYFALSNLEVKL